VTPTQGLPGKIEDRNMGKTHKKTS
jgi:hypothetical protein